MKNLFMNVKDAEASLAAQEGFQADSWYYFGRLFDEENGDEYDYLLHNTKVDGGEGMPQFAWQQVAFTNITKGTRVFDHKVYPMEELKASKDKLEVLMPESTITGNANEMQIKAQTPAGDLDLVVKPKGPVLYYNSGVFPWIAGSPNWEYAFPKMETKGTFTLNGKKLTVTGESFFDRQWVNFPPIVLTNDFKWSWFAINLDNGYVITVWDVIWKEEDGEAEQSFASVLSPEGANITADVVPLAKNASDIWESPVSGRKYNNKWIIEIPSLDTKLEVETTKHGHEMLSSAAMARPEGQQKPLHGLEHNMQTPANAKGIFQGKEVTGICHMELVGGW